MEMVPLREKRKNANSIRICSIVSEKYKAKQKLYKASGISIALYSLFFNYSQKRF